MDIAYQSWFVFESKTLFIKQSVETLALNSTDRGVTPSTKQHLFFLIDNEIQNFKTKQAFK